MLRGKNICLKERKEVDVGVNLKSLIAVLEPEFRKPATSIRLKANQTEMVLNCIRTLKRELIYLDLYEEVLPFQYI
jgi:hypothetical protein